MTEQANTTNHWRGAFGGLPLVAILRGLTPDTALPVVGALLDHGFRAIEIPLNSPRPFESIEAVVRTYGDRGVFGAGTVLTAADARRVLDTGARLIVAPNLDERVATVARDAGAIYCPGAMTPTEVFKAIELGAAFVKLFPAEAIPPVAIKALRAVVPAEAGLFPVGGISLETMAAYRAAGADGFGLGSALFKPGMPADEVGRRAAAFAAAWKQ